MISDDDVYEQASRLMFGPEIPRVHAVIQRFFRALDDKNWPAVLDVIDESIEVTDERRGVRSVSGSEYVEDTRRIFQPHVVTHHDFGYPTIAVRGNTSTAVGTIRAIHLIEDSNRAPYGVVGWERIGLSLEDGIWRIRSKALRVAHEEGSLEMLLLGHSSG